MLYRLKKWAKNRTKDKKRKTARDDGINTGDAHLYSSAKDYYESKAAQAKQTNKPKTQETE